MGAQECKAGPAVAGRVAGQRIYCQGVEFVGEKRGGDKTEGVVPLPLDKGSGGGPGRDAHLRGQSLAEHRSGCQFDQALAVPRRGIEQPRLWASGPAQAQLAGQQRRFELAIEGRSGLRRIAAPIAPPGFAFAQFRQQQVFEEYALLVLGQGLPGR